MKINEISENISHTSKRLRDIEREKKVKPGTDEWFKLWFSLPYLKEAFSSEPDPTGYQHTALTNPQYTIVVNTPGELDWYKLGQHFANLGHEDPHEYGQAESDMMIVAPNKEQLLRYMQELDRLGATYKLTGGSHEHPEVHIESNAFTDARMKAIKAGKKEFSVNSKMYPITGNIQDEIEAKTNESIENFNPQDPMSSSVLIQGYGTANLSTLMKNITNSIKQLGELRNDPDGFRQLKYALYDNEVLKAKLNALVTALDQLQEIKRKGGKRSVNIQKENISEETGKEMLKIFRGMHHDAGMNKDMDRFILSNDWELRDFTPDMFPSEEEFFDYDDPFDRIIDIDYSHRVNLSAPIIVGPQFSDGKYSVIDGNHRAAAAQRMGKTIKGYFPVKKTTEARTFQPQMTPMQDLIAEYQMFSSFGQMGLSDYAKSSDSAEKIKEVIRTLAQSNKSLQNLDKQALEKNKNKILTHIHDMMNYAIAHFREHLKPEQFDAKKQQINKLLTKYNNLTSTNENTIHEQPDSKNYLLQLERDKRANMLILHILDKSTGKRTEVRGKMGYETDGYDPNDKLHQLLDKVGKSASVSDLMNGDVVSINPRHPDGASAKSAADKAYNENFADGKNPGRKGLAKRMGVNTKASVSSLRKTAKNSSGEKQRMAHWLANMKAGREK
jgi:hypothetical protein